MGRGSSGLGGAGSRGGSSTLPPISNNVLGAQRTFYDTMNSQEARGANVVKFTSGMNSEPAYGHTWYANGSYEILTPAGTQRRNGEITTHGKRLYGIEQTPNGFDVTDLRTGLLIGQRDQSKYAVWNTILAFDDGVNRQLASRVRNAEATFKAIHH